MNIVAALIVLIVILVVGYIVWQLLYPPRKKLPALGPGTPIVRPERPRENTYCYKPDGGPEWCAVGCSIDCVTGL